MPKIVYRAAALRDLAEIAQFIELEAGSKEIAHAFVDRITTYCDRLAALPGLLGRARPDISKHARSITFGNHIILFRYTDEEGPRSHFYVNHIIHGCRDLDAYLSEHPDEEAGLEEK